MRIRQPFAGGFVVLLFLSASAGLAPVQIPSYKQSDKGLHFITFLLLSACFYWVLETNRRRVLHLSLFVCTLVGGVGSEVLQGLLPNGREFDPWDILANVVGSLAAIGLCTWYHKRMLERRRAARSYQAVPGEDEEHDLELGEGPGGQESGVIRNAPTMEEELDNWDENAEDWEEDEPSNGDAAGHKGSDAAEGDITDTKKRDD